MTAPIRKALIVDDSVTVRQILYGILTRRLNFHVVDQACNGKEAVEAAQENVYDIILLDWNMPEMLGIDALRTMRHAGVDAPILMVTTEAERTRVLDAVKAGANGYVLKPFVVNSLVDHIKTVLEKKSAQTPPSTARQPE